MVSSVKTGPKYIQINIKKAIYTRLITWEPSFVLAVSVSPVGVRACSSVGGLRI